MKFPLRMLACESLLLFGLAAPAANASEPPALDPIADIQTCATQVVNRAIRATDPDGDAITFTATGPAFMTLTSDLQVGNVRTGNLRIETVGVVSGVFSASVTATSGSPSLSDTKTFSISVICPPVFVNQPYDMTVPLNATADQTLSASNFGGLPVTFSRVSGPTFVTVITTDSGPGTSTGSVHVAPGSSDAGTYTVTVRADNGSLNTNASFTVTVCSGCGSAPALAPIANMTVSVGSTADQSITATDADGQALTFSRVSGPVPRIMQVSTTNPGTGTATGNIHVSPSASDAGSYSASVRASDGVLSDVKDFLITVTGPSGPPVMNPIPTPNITQGGCSPPTAERFISATDPDADAITFTWSGPPWVNVIPNAQSGTTRTANLMLGAPTASGTFHGLVTATAGGQSDSESFTIDASVEFERPVMVQPADMNVAALHETDQFLTATMPCPQQMTFLKMSGPAFMFVSTPDPSGGTATGQIHLEPSASDVGTYTAEVMVAAGNPVQSDRKTLTIIVRPAPCTATVFNGYDTIRLGSGRPFWFAYVQPATGCYDNTDVVISSFVMKYAGRQISASGRTSVGVDKSGDGIQEIRISFSKGDLGVLFAGLPSGHSPVDVTLEATLVSGALIQGTTQLDVVSTGAFSEPTVAPNPLNPAATLTYTTTKTGFVRIQLFDIHGRLVRRLVDEPAMEAGTHEVTIDGRGTRGEKLSSGVYFVRGRSTEGEFAKLITILK